MSEPSTVMRHVLRLLGLLLFLTALVLPVTDNAWHWSPQVPAMEKNPDPFAPIPWTWTALDKRWQSLRRGLLDKGFGLRALLVRYNNYLNVRVLHSSNLWDSVLAGPDGWLNLAQENPDLNVVQDWRNILPYPPSQLSRWVSVYTARRDALARQGVRYLIVICANKHGIYPEGIPPRINQAHPTGRTDQLLAALAEAGVEVLDLRPVMRAEREHRLAYYRTDNHWTPHGAFAGYQAITSRLAGAFPSMPRWERKDFNIYETPGLKGGYGYMLALGDYYPEQQIVYEPIRPRLAKEVEGPPLAGVSFQPSKAFETGQPGLPRAVVFRDSFSFELIPFLAEDFSRSVYVWPYPSDPVHGPRLFDMDLITAEKPDVVIDEFVERYFTVFLPK